jgi:hypothetical protein
MPVKVGTLLTNLAKKAGCDVSMLAIPADTFEIDDEVASALESRLFTEDAAKNNPALKNYFRAQALDAIDKKIVELVKEYEFPEDVINELTGIKNTYDRIPALTAKIRDLEAQKAAAGKSDKAQLQEQINRLNQEKAQLIAEKDKEIQQIRAQSANEITDFMKRNKIQSANLVTDQFPKEVVAKLAEDFLAQELNTQGARVINNNGSLKLVQASDEALNFYANNKEVTFDEFLDQTLAKYKLIAVNKPAGQQQSGPPSQQSPTTIPSAPAGNNPLLAQLGASLADVVKVS